jgi:hypothetical protein
LPGGSRGLGDVYKRQGEYASGNKQGVTWQKETNQEAGFAEDNKKE